MDDKTLAEKAEKFRREHSLGNRLSNSSDHYLVDIYKILAANGELLADDKNQAFSQLFMGKYKNLFTDETKDFALAYSYALHPLDEVQAELEDMGILAVQKTRKEVTEDGVTKEIIESGEVPITFQVEILRTFVDEWMRKRVPANRKRVREFIELITGQAVKESMQRNQIGNQGVPQEPSSRGRIA